MPRYKVIYSQIARETLLHVRGKADQRRLIGRLDTLQVFPRMGVVYDPPYEAVMPGHEILVTYAGNYGIYYTVDEREHMVYVEHVEDQRANPARRFGRLMPRR